MFERFTTQARDTVVRARAEARGLGHGHIGTEHLLLALLRQGTGVVHRVLSTTGLDYQQALADVRRLAVKPTALGEEDAAALRSIGIDLDAVLARMEESFGPEALEPPAPEPRRGLFGRRARPGSRFSPRARKVLELALREGIHLEHRALGAEHLLLGLVRDGSGTGARVLTENGVDLAELRRTTLAALGEVA